MRSITKRELNQQTAQVLAEVEHGSPVIVTERGVPRWRIETVGSEVDPIERLRAAGRLTPASDAPPPWPDDSAAPKRYDRAEIDAIVEEMKGER